MSDTRKSVPTVRTTDQPSTQENKSDSLDVLLSEFGQEAGKHVGNALAEEIHRNPEARRAAAMGAGIGVGIVAATAIVALLAE